MSVSQNGWALVGSGQLDSSPIPGTSIVPIPGVLEGDVATLLHWVGTEFNGRVEKLYSPGCWGWNAPTPIPGSNIYSNHCSGTAVDFNAPSFPWKSDRMSDGQKQACRDIVAQTEGVVVWGGDFTTSIDQMHFEINGTSEDVTRIVNKLKGEEVLNNKNDVDRIFLATLHRATDNEADAKRWYGLDVLTAVDRIRSSEEWLEQNHTLVVAHPDALKEIQSLKSSRGGVDKSSVVDYIAKNLK